MGGDVSDLSVTGTSVWGGRTTAPGGNCLTVAKLTTGKLILLSGLSLPLSLRVVIILTLGSQQDSSHLHQVPRETLPCASW